MLAVGFMTRTNSTSLGAIIARYASMSLSLRNVRTGACDASPSCRLTGHSATRKCRSVQLGDVMWISLLFSASVKRRCAAAPRNQGRAAHAERRVEVNRRAAAPLGEIVLQPVQHRQMRGCAVLTPAS